MQPSSSQRYLKIFSIIKLIFASITLLLAALSIFGIFAIDPAEIEAISQTTGEAVTDVPASELFTVGAAFLGVVLFATGLLDLVTGILGLRASKDNTKIMPVWWLTIIDLAITTINFIGNIVTAGINPTTLSGLLTIAISGVMFWLVNNIKLEAGK